MSRPSHVPPQFPDKAAVRRRRRAEDNARREELRRAEDERVRLEIEAQYVHAVPPWTTPGATVMVCGRCGAVVLGPTVHNQWHDRLDEVADRADSALQRNEVM